MIELYDAKTKQMLVFNSKENLERYEQFGEKSFIEARACETPSFNWSVLYFD